MEYTSGGSTWRKALRRAMAGLRIREQRRPGWSMAVPLIGLAAGVLFTTSATTAAGTDLREESSVDLREVLTEKAQSVDAQTELAERLRAEIDDITARRGDADEPTARQLARGEGYRQAAGLTPLHGPGLTVRMDDALVRTDGTLPKSASLDDLVVHQADIQAVVNALWVGGAEAMTITGAGDNGDPVRIISTTAIICVGNTLLLDGRHYSPEFVISAIGDPGRLQAALDAAEGVRAFRAAVADFGLGYKVSREEDIVAPAYQGSIELRYAAVPE